MTSPLLTQHARLISIETAQGSHLPDSFVVDSFTGYEAINTMFVFDIQALSPSTTVDVATLIGEEVTLRLLLADSTHRAWHGYCSEAKWLGADGGLARYHLRLVPFLSFLQLRRDSFIFQDKDVRQIVTEVFADYPQANFAWEATQPLIVHPICTQYRESDLAFITRILAAEGLSWRFEHEQDSTPYDSDAETASTTANGRAHAKHQLVIFESRSELPPIPGDDVVRFHGVRATEETDSIHQFTAVRQVLPNAATIASWDANELVAPAAELQHDIDLGEVPDLPVYQGSAEHLLMNSEHAERVASLQLEALTMSSKTFSGAGGARTLIPGHVFSLSQHEAYPEGDNRFKLLSVSHAASNNFTFGVNTQLSAADDLERGIYRNQFTCVREPVPIAPPLTAMRRRGSALGAQTAIVVGLENATITTERDHKIKVQFAWQRGLAPLSGGLHDTGNLVDKSGNAPLNEQSGTWVRVAESLAGPNWGSHFTPRIGSEVVVNFIEGDIDRPLIVASVHNGVDTPPYAAGVDSGVNHGGTISGLHSQALSGDGYNQWVVDDTGGQLRMRMASSTGASQLNLGYLIQQSPYSAQRGAYRGQGFELRTDTWGVLRGAEGVLISSTARSALGSSVTSTQMDAAESVAQLKGAEALSQNLTKSAEAQKANTSQLANAAQQTLIQEIDQKQLGKYTGAVNGQPALKAKMGSRELDGGQPVERFNTPRLHVDSASSLNMASPASTLIFAGQQLHWTTQADSHWAAGHTYSSVSGNATTWYTHSGGIQALAANGAVSIQAHTDALEILADKEIVVTSSHGHISINAKSTVSLKAGKSSITLSGSNITFKCPGTFTVKSGMHDFKGAKAKRGKLPKLPAGVVMPSQTLEERYSTYRAKFRVLDKSNGEPITQKLYRSEVDGITSFGYTDKHGDTHIEQTNKPEKVKAQLEGNEKMSQHKLTEEELNQWFERVST